MASLGGVLIVNRRAPVRAWTCDALDVTRDFANMDEFENWYRPSHHGDANKRVNSQYLFTDVLLDDVSDPPSHKAAKGTTKARAVRAPPTNTKSRVMVDGVEYASVFKAFEALGLPVPKHGKFRKDLKIAGALPFEHDGKTHKFTTTGG